MSPDDLIQQTNHYQMILEEQYKYAIRDMQYNYAEEISSMVNKAGKFMVQLRHIKRLNEIEACIVRDNG